MRHHERHRPVQSHGVVDFVLKDIKIVEPVWIRIWRVCSSRGGERKGGGMLGKTIDVFGAGKANVDSDGSRA
jgi:hypothetical protein